MLLLSLGGQFQFGSYWYKISVCGFFSTRTYYFGTRSECVTLSVLFKPDHRRRVLKAPVKSLSAQYLPFDLKLICHSPRKHTPLFSVFCRKACLYALQFKIQGLYAFYIVCVDRSVRLFSPNNSSTGDIPDIAPSNKEPHGEHPRKTWRENIWRR